MAEAGVVGRIRQQAAIGADAERANGHELLPLGEFVHVKDDLLGRVGLLGSAAAEARVLLALLGPGKVLPGAVAVGNGAVVLLNMRQDFAVKLAL